MRQLRQMLRLAREGVSAREIGRTLGVARSTVQDNLKRAEAAGLRLAACRPRSPIAVLEQRLFARAGVRPGLRRRVEPDWACACARAEAARRQSDGAVGGVPGRPPGRLRLQPVLRPVPRVRAASLAGDAPAPCGRRQGVRRLLGQEGAHRRPRRPGWCARPRSSSPCSAPRTSPTPRRPGPRRLPDWIGAHVRLFRFLDGVPRLVVPDNLKSGVHKASFYDPEINRSYGMMAAHYGVGILPARPRKPRDKAKVEAGVRFAQTYILGRLRRQTFFSLAECNAAIATAVERINAHLMRRLGVSRRELFESIERPALRPLPAEDYEYRRMAPGPGQPRLSRRGRGLPLLGAARADPRAGRRAPDQPHRRGVPSRPARRRPSAPLRRTPARHRSRSHASARTGAMPSGRRSASGAGRARSGPTRRGSSSPCSPAAPIPSRASAPAWACCGSTAGSTPPGRKPSRPGPSRSARSPTRASPRSSPTISTAPRRRPRAAPVIDHPNVRGPRYFH